MVIVDKPPGVLAVPAPGRSGPTMTDLVARVLGVRVFAVHRLDEQTTGAMVFALDEETKVALEDMFRAHTIERDYLALLSSAPSPPAGRIDGPLAVDAAGLGLRCVAPPALTQLMLDDPSGDPLDAWLCLLQAAWASRQPRWGQPADVDPLEGWIVGAQ